MDHLIKDDPFKVDNDKFVSPINHELLQPFLILLNQIMIILRTFMTTRQIEILATMLWSDFVTDYTPKSSKGFLIVGKRKTDPENSFFFWERTFGKPEERIKEWKDREQKFSMECADTIFGEQFSQALLGHIRIHRCRICDLGKDNPKMEVEWFTMNSLTWENLKTIMTEVNLFVQSIKTIKGIIPLDINTISFAQIKTLPLIGDKLATNIVAKRTEKLFTDFQDMKKRVPKLGNKIINAFREFVIFGNQIGDQENRLININTATAEVLEELPKIGSILSKNIVNYRTTQPFASKDDIKKVYKVGPKIYEAIKDLITV